MVYDYLVVGAGLFGSIFAYEANKRGKKCLVIEKRNHIAGNLFTNNLEGINVHEYGAHIFHTSNEEVWKYIKQFADFNNYINSPIAIYKDEVYNLPFNMNTFYKLWKVKTPKEAKLKLQEEVRKSGIVKPKNLEEQAISLVGEEFYNKLIKGYTEKQWGKKATELPAFIIKRIPVRYTYDNNYFNDIYQGIPLNGYTNIIAKMLNNIEVRLNTDFFENKNEFKSIAKKIVFTGMIDQFYDYKYGTLEYRSLRFQHEILEEENFQGNAVVNYTEADIPYTRIIEHKHFEKGRQQKTIITKEYPEKWESGKEAYYPINDERNNSIYKKYKCIADKEESIIFGGRLAEYKYYDMEAIIRQALQCVKEEFKTE